MNLWVGHDFRTQKLSVPTVTLTFDLGTWFLHATRRLVLMIICAEWFLNPTMDNEVMGWTQIWNTHTHWQGKLYMPFHHFRGWSGEAKVLGKLSVPGRPTSLDDRRARAYCACSRCEWGLFGHYFPHLSFLFPFSLFLGDGIDWNTVSKGR